MEAFKPTKIVLRAKCIMFLPLAMHGKPQSSLEILRDSWGDPQCSEKNNLATLYMNTTGQILRSQAAQSEYEFKYRTDLAPNKLGKQFARECAPYLGGCKQFNVNSNVVDDYARVIPGPAGWGRTGERIQTQLMGGPFKARGEGILANPDALSEAWTPSGGYKQHCAKPLSETTFDTWQCMGAPLAYETKDHIPKDTRQGMQYITKC